MHDPGRRRCVAPAVAAVAAVLAVLAVTSLAVLVGATPALAQPDDDARAQELVDRYAPIVQVRTQPEPCDPDGEPFAPMAVERLLDNPQVALRQVGNGDPTVLRAPAAGDLHDLGAGFYLDLPGDALNPGCLYEQDDDRFNAGSPSVVYAHIAQQPDRPDLLAVQYWLFWYYNDWNNRHEGDWEFIQLLFEASTVDEALAATGPVSVGYAQHEGGERADWDDDKLEREGSRPVVHSSERSHASYFESALFLGRSASEGFGCDDTDGPSTRIDPQVELLPTTVPDAGDPLAWIDFEGRWGERQLGPNSGPTGPNDKPQWTRPVDWHDSLRDHSFIVPTGDSQAAAVVDAFCGIVEWGSVQFIRLLASPTAALVVAVLLFLLVRALIRRTSWARVGDLPLVRRRRAGEIARVAVARYRHQPLTLAVIGAIAVPIAVLAVLATVVVDDVPFLRGLVSVVDTGDAGGRAAVSTFLATIFSIVAFVIISAAVSWVVAGPAAPEGAGQVAVATRALRAVAGRAGPLAAVFAIALLVVLPLHLVLIGIPIAVWLVVRWVFAPQVVMLEGVGALSSLRASAARVRRRWWHTFLVALVLTVLVSSFGIAVGLLVLVIATSLPLWALSAVVTVCNVVVMPYAALVMTYLYGDAVAAAVEREAASLEREDATSAAQPVPMT